ncbi:Hypothetical predicted protein, partial [Marmota monax]
MCTATGLYYGDAIWVILSVEVGGLLGVTQQLSSFETEFNTQPHRKVEGNFNPFASPQKNRQSDENNLKDPGGSGFDSISKNTWAPAPDQTEQDQNRLSQNSVNLSPSSHANNLSIVTYSKEALEYLLIRASVFTRRFRGGLGMFLEETALRGEHANRHAPERVTQRSWVLGSVDPSSCSPSCTLRYYGLTSSLRG